MRDAQRVNGSEELTRIPKRYARGKGEHIDKQEEYGGRPTRRRKPSYWERLGEEYRSKTNLAARELPDRLNG